eukprot:6196654-Pleurochrysis_carterae.AAC.3
MHDDAGVERAGGRELRVERTERSEVRADGAGGTVPRAEAGGSIAPTTTTTNPSMLHGRFFGHDEDTNVASAEGR